MLGITLLALALACSGDESDSPVEPVDGPDEFEVFWEQFQYMKIVTAEMTRTKFDCIGIVLDSAAGAVGKPALADLYQVKYYPEGHWWVFTVDEYRSDAGEMFFVFDSIQFSYEDGPVRFPNYDSLVSINSYGWYVPLDSPFTNSYVHQHLYMSMATAGSDTIVATGEGDFNVLVLDAVSPVAGREDCYLSLNYWLPEIELYFDLSVTRPGDGTICPYDGYVWFEGRMDMYWQDTDTLVCCNWDVWRTHAQDTVWYDVIDIRHDSTHYNYTDMCE